MDENHFIHCQICKVKLNKRNLTKHHKKVHAGSSEKKLTNPKTSSTPETIWKLVKELAFNKNADSATEAAVIAIESYKDKNTHQYGEVLTKLHRIFKESYISSVDVCFYNLVNDATDWNIAENKPRPYQKSTHIGWSTIKKGLISNPHGLPDYQSPIRKKKIQRKEEADFTKKNYDEKIRYHLNQIEKILSNRYKGAFLNSITQNELRVVESSLRDLVQTVSDIQKYKLDDSGLLLHTTQPEDR